MASILEQVLKVMERGELAVLVTVVASGGAVPFKVGAKALISASGEVVGALEGEWLLVPLRDEARGVLRDEKPRFLEYQVPAEETARLGLAAGGSLQVFLELVGERPRLVVVGAGHISAAVVPVARLLGFHVTVIDDRPYFANRERFPTADEVIAGDFTTTLKGMSFTPWTYVVLVTRGHEHDEDSLRVVIDKPVRYLGMIGSKRRVLLVFKRLLADGYAVEDFAKVYAPIGLDIGAETPEEIAVGIMAEVVKVRRGGSAASLTLKDAVLQRALEKAHV